MEAIAIPARTLGMLALRDFCPHCHWIFLHYDDKFPFQIPMPGIFNSIDSYGKKVVHTFFDQNKALPPWFPAIGEVTGYVPSRNLHWKRFSLEDQETKITLRGTPDDIFCLADKSFHIVDYKTAKATEKQDELFPAYAVQLNVYAYICRAQGMSPVSGLSLIYTEPQTDMTPEQLAACVSEEAFALTFKATLRQVELSADKLIPELLRRTREIFEMPTPPKGKEWCENCGLLDQLMKVCRARTTTP